MGYIFIFAKYPNIFLSAIGPSLMIHHSQWKECGMSFNYSCGVVEEVVSLVVLCLITCLLASGLMFNYAIYCRLPLPSPGHREAFSYYTNHPSTSTADGPPRATHKQYTQTKSAAGWIKQALEDVCRRSADRRETSETTKLILNRPSVAALSITLSIIHSCFFVLHLPLIAV